MIENCMLFNALYKVWESQSGKELLSMTGHTDALYGCAFSSNDARIISCSADHTVKVCAVLCFRLLSRADFVPQKLIIQCLNA